MQLPKAVRNILLVLLFIWIIHGPIVDIFVDWLWFDSLGYLDVYKTRLYARLALWVVGFGIAAGFVAFNIRHASVQQPLDYERISMTMAELEIRPERIRNIVRAILGLWIVLPALFFGGVAQAHWLEFLAWRNQVPFGIADSVWGNDIGFYVFELPIWRLVHGLGVALIIVALLPVVLLYVGRDLFILRATPRLTGGARTHVLSLLGVLFVFFGLGWWLDRFDLLTSHSGAVWGVSYTDLNARVPGYWVMMGAALLVAALFFSAVRQSSWRMPAVGAGAYFVFRIVITGLWPTLVQDYLVAPNEFERERQFIQQNIEFTRAAYGLENIEVRDFPASGQLTPQAIQDNPETINNLRIWDSRPLLTTYGALQEIRPYYELVGVDVDRYTINGEPRQVMLSARELDHASLPTTAQSWVNEHIFYTHGYGMVMSPVNEIYGKGLPGLFMQNIPPELSDTVETKLTQEDMESLGLMSDISPPEEGEEENRTVLGRRAAIYYGELSNDYVLVRTAEREMDFAYGNTNVYTCKEDYDWTGLRTDSTEDDECPDPGYGGEGGVGIGSLARRVLFAMHFQDTDILLSQYLQEDSRILFRRQIVERVKTLAPFLKLDSDPYVVLSEGRMVFMIDAFTATDAYPYSEPTYLEGQSGFNYIRNPVKVVVDAYDGTVDFYVSDDSDPLIQVYSQIFPTLFQSMDAMSEDLKAHIRYPRDYFDIQADTYRSYHMTDPLVFYNKEDMWEVPQELYAGQEQPVESYYLIMKLPPDPNSDVPEQAKFILLLPFNPVGKPNMTAWMAADCDYGEGYGSLVLYQFNRGDFYNGPRQIEAQIDQDVEISQKLTLWDSKGSQVVRGNLLVVPIENSLLYVEPLYIQSEGQSQMPELKQVIVFYGDPQKPEEAQVVMERTLDLALEELFARIDSAKSALTESSSSQAGSVDLSTDGQSGSEAEAEAEAEAETTIPGVTAVSGTWQEGAQEAHALFVEATTAAGDGDWEAYGAALEQLEAQLKELAETAAQAELPSTPQGAEEETDSQDLQDTE